MSEENEVLSLEQLQALAAEQDRLSGYEEGEHPAIQPAQAIETMKAEVSKPDKVDEPSEKVETPEAKSEPEPNAEPEPAKADDSDDNSSLKSEGTDDRLLKSEKRLNESWRKVNSEKDALAEERRELEELRNSLNERAKPNEYVDEDGHTAADYEAAARNFAAEGEDGLAKKAQQQADAVRAAEQHNKMAMNDATFKEEWGNNFDRAAESYPELKDHNSPFRKAVNDLLESRSVLTTYSGGIIDAADIVAMQIKAGESSNLQEQIKSLSDENSSLKSKLSIGGSDPTAAPTGATSFEQLSPEEQFAELQRRAAQADGAYH